MIMFGIFISCRSLAINRRVLVNTADALFWAMSKLYLFIPSVCDSFTSSSICQSEYWTMAVASDLVSGWAVIGIGFGAFFFFFHNVLNFFSNTSYSFISPFY